MLNVYTMTRILINNKLKLNHHGLRVKASDNTWIDLHCQQGRLDGACAVYSLVMALLSIGYLEETDINVYQKLDQRTAKGRFLHHLLEEQGMVRDGYSLMTLSKEIRRYCEDLEVVYHHKEEILLEKIIKDVQDNNPVVIGIENEEMSHAILVVGIEYDDKERIQKMFCLDPGFPLSGTAYWNCVIVLNSTSGKYAYRYMTDISSSSKVNITDMLMIKNNRC